jgi:hypothetical protein
MDPNPNKLGNAARMDALGFTDAEIQERMRYLWNKYHFPVEAEYIDIGLAMLDMGMLLAELAVEKAKARV